MVNAVILSEAKDLPSNTVRNRCPLLSNPKGSDIPAQGSALGFRVRDAPFLFFFVARSEGINYSSRVQRTGVPLESGMRLGQTIFLERQEFRRYSRCVEVFGWRNTVSERGGLV